jgi:hypothetical protein
MIENDDGQTRLSVGAIHGDLTMSTITRPSDSPAPSPTTSTETTTVPDEERGVMRDVSWEFYDRLSDAIGEQSQICMAYDGNDMEIMTLYGVHVKCALTPSGVSQIRRFAFAGRAQSYWTPY